MTQTALFQTPRTDWTQALPDWLANNLDTINDQPAGDPIRLAECARCHQPVLHGKTSCTKWTLDPTTLDNRLEVAATILSIRTFSITTNIFGFHTLASRQWWIITSRPASATHIPNPLGGRQPLTHYVVPEHKCGRTLGQPITWEALYHPPRDVTDDGICPF